MRILEGLEVVLAALLAVVVVASEAGVSVLLVSILVALSPVLSTELPKIKEFYYNIFIQLCTVVFYSCCLWKYFCVIL